MKPARCSFDQKLIPRVRHYLTENPDADDDQIVDFLMERFSFEYKRRNRDAFRRLVSRRAQDIRVLQYSSDEYFSNEAPPLSDDDIPAYKDTNMVNKTLKNLYNTPAKSSESGSNITVSLPSDNLNRTQKRKEPAAPDDGRETKKAKMRAKPSSKSIDSEIEAAIMEKAKKSKDVALLYPTLKLKDLGGMDEAIHDVYQLLIHMKHPEIYHHLGVSPPRGFLLHGPPGCGKTMFASAIAGELEVPLLRVAAPEVVAGVSGESEERIREYFEKAIAAAPCIFFIDEIDAITPKRETAQREMERRIVAQLLSSLDDLSQRKLEKEVLVIGATNRPDSIDPALRRAGRFDREIRLGIPSESDRLQILSKLIVPTLKVDGELNLARLAHLTPGYVGADLASLVREASVLAVTRILDELKDVKKDASDDTAGASAEAPLSEEDLCRVRVEQRDFDAALSVVQPSSKREGFATVPDVTWDHVGALKGIREALELSILAPIRYKECFDSLGLSSPSGILLYGPPGCGKTLVAKAIANESGLNFISVKGPELLSMYVGESERGVRACFERARNSAPCVIFFDEIDALCPKRSGDLSGGASRLVNQMLTEMDGLETRKQVFVLAATNRPDIIDPAMLRPGRLDQMLFVGLPELADRIDILKTITRDRKRPLLDQDVSLEELGEKTHGFSGADLSALVKQASLAALKDFISSARTSMTQHKELSCFKSSATEGVSQMDSSICVKALHFSIALTVVKPSNKDGDQAYRIKGAG